MDGVAPLSTDGLRRVLAQVTTMAQAVDDADRIERVRLFEELKSAIAAEQMAVAVRFAESQQRAQAIRGVPTARQGRGVAAQVALARRISPWAAQRWLGCARILRDELPETFAQLRAGQTSEWRAMLVARETAMLSRPDRATVDRELAPRLEALGDRKVEREARALACRLDPQAATDRARNAAKDRCVSIRPAPDLMCRVSTLVPLAQGVAAYAALTKHADTVIGTGAQGVNESGTLRSRGQVMADTLIERVTGQTTADDVNVEIGLVMTDATLLGGDEPANLTGYGPIPAPAARALARGRIDLGGRVRAGSRRWLRRIITTRSGRLIAMESQRREFTTAQRAFIEIRDQTCRTPWCDAPIRHADHVRPYGRGGPTSIENGQGLCEACNYARQAQGWTATVDADGTVNTRTPTGHSYESRAPDAPDAIADTPTDTAA